MVQRGDPVTLTPASPVQPICGLPIIVYSPTVKAEPFAAVYPTGSNVEWHQYGRDEFAFPDCLPLRTGEAQTFRVPADFPPGDYIVCVGEFPDGCGPLSIR